MTSSYSKTSTFVRPHVNEKAGVFGEHFTGYVWTVGQTGERNIPFETKTDTCGQG